MRLKQDSEFCICSTEKKAHRRGDLLLNRSDGTSLNWAQFGFLDFGDTQGLLSTSESFRVLLEPLDQLLLGVNCLEVICWGQLLQDNCLM